MPGLGTINVVQNIVFMLQENRSFDSYFGMLNAYQKTVKGIANPQVEALALECDSQRLAGNPIKPYHYQTACTDAITPAWGASITQYADGKLDGFMRTLPRAAGRSGRNARDGILRLDGPPLLLRAGDPVCDQRSAVRLGGGAHPGEPHVYLSAASSYGNVDFGPVPQTAPTIFDRLTAAGITWKYYYVPTIPPRA